MREIIEHMDRAFGLLSRMLVSHDNVDLVAAAKLELAAAYKRAEVLEQREENDGSDH